ncbi:MAG: hypothetical protein JNM47_00210 [Hyphomonadaceae bacterium]|nr:hypothetical protein [Hyphomonadaceae bacterium]
MWKMGAAAMAAFACIALPAAAQTSEYRQQLDQQLQKSRELFQQQGYTIAAGPFTGALAAGGKERFTLPVQSGYSYKILGICDNDCSDVDLRIFNMNGQNIGEDVTNDDVPLVDLQPTGNGTVQLEANMITCSAAPCYHAIEVYWKR